MKYIKEEVEKIGNTIYAKINGESILISLWFVVFLKIELGYNSIYEIYLNFLPMVNFVDLIAVAIFHLA